MKKSDQELLDLYFQERASDEQIAELERRMLADSELRTQYLQVAMTESSLRKIALQEHEVPSQLPQDIVFPPSREKSLRQLVFIGSLAACAALFFWIGQEKPTEKPTSVGVILSSELAGWQSENSTIDGAEFSPGVYTLRTGIVTMGFHSGAEMVLEGPARIEVVTDMEIIFDYGNASFSVPEQAIGFQVTTRHGKVVDLGTRFSLSIGENQGKSRLTVEEGEIALHHNDGSVKHLVTEETASMDEKSIHLNLDPTSEDGLETSEALVILRTNGREATVAHRKLRETLRTDFLMVKNTENRANAYFDRKALIAFDVSGVDLDQVAQARLILNSVPTKVGVSSNMPVVSEFGIYGIPDDKRENWASTGLLKKDAPKLEGSPILATFPIPRANLRTAVVLETPELLAFLKADQSGEVGFIIHCQTPGNTMIHGFASSQHREAAGPTLELIMKE
ncbi:MAG: FecR domain-containing protein [Akkermansiaceae bacterium]